MAALPPVVFDRVISDGLEAVLAPEGVLHGLVDRSLTGSGLFDLQLRANPKSRASWASVYVGLTAVLNVAEVGGRFRLSAHATHQTSGGFDQAWTELMSLEELAVGLPEILSYIDSICAPGGVASTHTASEGRVQGLLCAGSAKPTLGFQREAAPTFLSDPIKSALVAPFRARILEAAHKGMPLPAPKWWPGVRNRGAVPRLGLEIDVLGVGPDGRLLVVEVKPSNALEGITWAPAQVRLYADVVALWLEVDPFARDRVIEMCRQRTRLGLPAPDVNLPPASALRVVPVVAIGEGKQSAVALDRLGAVHEAVASAEPHSARLDPLEVWTVRSDGSVTAVAGAWSQS